MGLFIKNELNPSIATTIVVLTWAELAEAFLQAAIDSDYISGVRWVLGPQTATDALLREGMLSVTSEYSSAVEASASLVKVLITCSSKEPGILRQCIEAEKSKPAFFKVLNYLDAHQVLIGCIMINTVTLDRPPVYHSQASDIIHKVSIQVAHDAGLVTPLGTRADFIKPTKEWGLVSLTVVLTCWLLKELL
jgi:hypothetical protein